MLDARVDVRPGHRPQGRFERSAEPGLDGHAQRRVRRPERDRPVVRGERVLREDTRLDALDAARDRGDRAPRDHPLLDLRAPHREAEAQLDLAGSARRDEELLPARVASRGERRDPPVLERRPDERDRDPGSDLARDRRERTVRDDEEREQLLARREREDLAPIVERARHPEDARRESARLARRERARGLVLAGRVELDLDLVLGRELVERSPELGAGEVDPLPLRLLGLHGGAAVEEDAEPPPLPPGVRESGPARRERERERGGALEQEVEPRAPLRPLGLARGLHALGEELERRDEEDDGSPPEPVDDEEDRDRDQTHDEREKRPLERHVGFQSRT